MRTITKRLIAYALIFVIAILVLNFPVTTRQGINGELFIRKIPLYAKIGGFLYRNYQYKELALRITEGNKNDTDKVEAVYNWTTENIKSPPEGFPIVDDHIWDIIVRGYGVRGQKADVFTTLASYAGYEAFWEKLYSSRVDKPLVLSFVRIGNKWHIFDVYNKKAFISTEGLALPTPSGPAYVEYLKTMDKAKFKSCLRRPDRQKILSRIIHEFKRLFR
ncbi:transglutaminase-like domain-containing protein [Candidatus Omnitrophota bacterium]